MNEEELKLPNEWFEYLPEPYRTQALANYNNDKRSDYEVGFNHCLFTGFTWAQTDEGHQYWRNAHDRLRAGIIQKVEPKYKRAVTNFLEGVEL